MYDESFAKLPFALISNRNWVLFVTNILHMQAV